MKPSTNAIFADRLPGIGVGTNGVLCVTGPELSVGEWAARYVTAY